MSLLNRRTRYVLVPVEIEIYDTPDEKNVLGSIKGVPASTIKEQMTSALEGNGGALFESEADAWEALNRAGIT